MTKQEAEREALKRWGDDALRRFGFAVQYSPRLFSVGYIIDTEKGFERPLVGEGDSWEAAFANAAEKEKENQ